MSLKASNDLAIRQFQSEVDALREAPDPLAARLTVWVLAALIVVGLALILTTRIDRVVASTAGKVLSAQPPIVVQSLDPAIIKSIDVKEGDKVVAGQLLATLDPTFAEADVGQLEQQLASLDAQIARDDAEQAGREPAFHSNPSADARRYIDIQRALYQQRQGQYRAQLASFDAKIAQLQTTIQKLQSDVERYKQREDISKQIEDMRSTLAASGSGSRLNLLTSTDQRLEMLRTMEFDRNALVEAQHGLAAAQADREAFIQQWLAAVAQDLVTARNTRDNARAQYEKATRHQDLVRLTAPDDSVVLSIAKLSVGSVLKGGDEFLRLVPLGTPLEAEVHVAARDIGFMRPGDHATLKIDSFNFMEYGTAEGTVKWVSEGAFTTEDNGQLSEAYYKVRVGIDRVNFVHVPENFRLLPGMTLTADIHVGTRSVASYLFSGVVHGATEALREP